MNEQEQSPTKKYSLTVAMDILPKNNQTTTFQELFDKLNEISYELCQESHTIEGNEYERGYWLGCQHMLYSLSARNNLSDTIK